MNQSLPKEVLQWLFKVLQPEYKDPRTTYQDVAIALERHRNLRPRTRIYTSDTGRTQLLLCLYGKLQTTTIDRRPLDVPILLWIPQEYPQQPPFAFIDLSDSNEEIHILPGAYVDNNGQCQMPYLQYWNVAETGSVVKVIDQFTMLFGQEPPIFQANAMPESSISPQGSFHGRRQDLSAPPPLPPKPGASGSLTGGFGGSFNSITPSSTGGFSGHFTPANTGSAYASSTSFANADELYAPRNQHPQQQQQQHHVQYQQYQQGQSGQYSGFSDQAKPPVYNREPVVPPVQEMNVLDLNDGPSLPQNPRREMVLDEIEKKLQGLQQEIVQEKNTSEQQKIDNIKNAIVQFEDILRYEKNTVDDARRMLEQNRNTVAVSIERAEQTIAEADAYGEVNTNDVVKCDNTVYNQIYNLCAEEQAISDVIYVISKAHSNGQISFDEFVKKTRSLGRERFMKKALIKKIWSSVGW